MNIGLDKLEDTQREVTELNRGLAAKERELVAKNKEANEKLERMLVDQNDAEQKRAVRVVSLSFQLCFMFRFCSPPYPGRRAQPTIVIVCVLRPLLHCWWELHLLHTTSLYQVNVKLGAELEVQKAYIAQRNAGVQADLSEAEPALLQAQESVRLIKRTQLDELRCTCDICRLKCTCARGPCMDIHVVFEARARSSRRACSLPPLPSFLLLSICCSFILLSSLPLAGPWLHRRPPLR